MTTTKKITSKIGALIGLLLAQQVHAISVSSLEATTETEIYNLDGNYYEELRSWNKTDARLADEISQLEDEIQYLNELYTRSFLGHQELVAYVNNRKNDNPQLVSRVSISNAVTSAGFTTTYATADDFRKAVSEDIRSRSDQAQVVKLAKNQNAENKPVRLIPLAMNPAVNSIGEDGKLSPRITLSSWMPITLKANDPNFKWRLAYGVNVDLASGPESADAEKAADEFLLNGGDGKIELEGAARYMLHDNFNIVLGATYGQAWLKSDVSQDGSVITIDDEIRQATASITFETSAFYYGVEKVWNDYQGSTDNTFGYLVDGNNIIKHSFLVAIPNDFYLRYDTFQGTKDSVSTVSITKTLKLF